MQAFPDNFLFGVSTSDHQAEAYNSRYADVWDWWEQEQRMTPRGRATDFVARYREDVALAASLGCRAFRFSVSWARVEPAPGVVNRDGWEYYRDLVRAIREAGMEPILTLHHWTWPLHVEERGGMIAEAFPTWFRRYAAEAAAQLGEYVRYWITVNEPNALPFGYVKFWWQKEYPMPPGLPGAGSAEQADATARCIRNLFRAHASAREEIRAARPGARVGANPCVLGMPEWFQQWADHRLSSVRSQTEWARLHEEGGRSRPPGPFLRKLGCLTTLLNTNWWHLGLAGKLPPFLCPAECVGRHDFVGLDYYWGINSLRLPNLFRIIETMQQNFAKAPVDPRGLYRALRHHARLFPDLPILIAENGAIGKVDGMDRAAYLQRHLGEVARAMRHGVNICGYVWWSITTCREWGLPCEPSSDFGLFHIDLDTDPTLTRIPTPAAAAYRDVIRHGLPEAQRLRTERAKPSRQPA